MKKKINLFEAFSGIWSQHRALENIWFEVHSVGISDWYIDAIVAYGVEYLWIKWQKIDKNLTIEFLKWYSLSRDSKKPLKSYAGYSDEKLSILEQVIKKFGNLDINHIHWEDLVDKDIDLFTYSFPCQDISQQWKRAGFSKWKKSRSWLLWEIERILQEIKAINPSKLPKYLMMENVKAILNKEFAPDLQEWKDELKKLGYESTDAFVVNASDVWSAQNRSRVFMVSKLKTQTSPHLTSPLEERDSSKSSPLQRGARGGEKKWTLKQFPKQSVNKKTTLWKILQKNMEREKFSTEKDIEIIREYWKKNVWVKKWFIKWYTTFNAECYVYYKDWLAPTITASWAQSRIKYFEDDWEIYFLNSLEHFLLQGFSKKFYNKLKKLEFNENKIKFLAGNSINVQVLEKIFSFYLK